MKKYLMELIARKKNEILELQKRSDASQDIAEVRSIGTQIESIKGEISDAEAQLAKVEEDEQRNAVVPQDAQLRNAVVVSSTGVKAADEDGMEYRKAFMAHVLRGTPIPTELRGDANTLTSDVATAIPTQLVNRIIDRMEKTGEILALITRTAISAGVEIPIMTLKPVATWVAEGAGSDRQKVTTGKVSFTNHKLRCEVSMSMEVSVMTISAFETRFTELVAEAMVWAIEEAIINGTGSGQPKGILAETPVDGQAIEVSTVNYGTLISLEGALPEKYEANAKYCMNKATFLKFAAMVDDNGQPIGRVTYGIGGKPERYLLGRDVVISSHVANDNGFIFDFKDYILNTIYDMGISKKQDWDTEDMLTKAVMSVDGKVVDKGSLVTFEIAESV